MLARGECPRRRGERRMSTTRPPGATHIAVERGAQGLPLETGSTDLVLAYEVAPVTGSTWFWHEARRALRPGGALVFTHWNRLSWRGLAYRAMHRLHKPPEQGCRGSNPSSTPARATRPFVAYSVPTGFGSSTRRASAGFRSAARATHARSLLAHGSRARSGYATSFARAPSSSASPASNR